MKGDRTLGRHEIRVGLKDVAVDDTLRSHLVCDNARAQHWPVIFCEVPLENLNDGAEFRRGPRVPFFQRRGCPERIHREVVVRVRATELAIKCLKRLSVKVLWSQNRREKPDQVGFTGGRLAMPLP